MTFEKGIIGLGTMAMRSNDNNISGCLSQVQVTDCIMPVIELNPANKEYKIQVEKKMYKRDFPYFAHHEPIIFPMIRKVNGFDNQLLNTFP